MKDYELTVVFHPDLEMNIDPALDKVKKLIATMSGEITKEETEGKKRLGYRIKDQDFGIYYFFDVKLPAEAPGKIETTLNITDEVIRHMLVKADPRRAKLAARRQARDKDAEASEKEAKPSTEEVKLTEEKGE